MTPRERRVFAQLWGKRSDPVTENGYAKPDKLRRMKEAMDQHMAMVDPNTAAAIHAAFDYGVNLTRAEYRPLANRNWRTIQKFGVRATRLLVALIVVLGLLGWRALETTNEIQGGRRSATIDKCHEGQHALLKLKAEISHIADPVKRAEEEAQEHPTQELLETITGPIDLHDSDCTVALRRAGL